VCLAGLLSLVTELRVQILVTNQLLPDEILLKTDLKNAEDKVNGGCLQQIVAYERI
jgi:hypothetical protein